MLAGCFCSWIAHRGCTSSGFPPLFQAVKLLVLAQLPPPVHGQSVMVATLVGGLPAHGIEVTHVDLRLSRAATEIGRWQPGKIAAVIDACVHALFERFRAGCDTLYYVPAPGKRGALYRDWVVMLLCRPFFRRLVFHWHAAGLGEWLRTRATGPERVLTRLLLGRADLAIVLGESLRDDATTLAAKSVAVVPNGIADPAPDFDSVPRNRPPPGAPFEVLFLGLCSEDKGLFAAAEAVLAANRQAGAGTFRLTAAGAFPDAATAGRFAALARAHPGALRHVGFVAGEAKRALLAASHCLCLPTRYPHEGQPLVVLEALAAGLPAIVSRWRGLPDLVTPATGRLVPPADPAALANALVALRAAPPDPAACRDVFLRRHTREQHLAQLAAALSSFATRKGAPA